MHIQPSSLVLLAAASTASLAAASPRPLDDRTNHLAARQDPDHFDDDTLPAGYTSHPDKAKHHPLPNVALAPTSVIPILPTTTTSSSTFSPDGVTGEATFSIIPVPSSLLPSRSTGAGPLPSTIITDSATSTERHLPFTRTHGGMGHGPVVTTEVTRKGSVSTITSTKLPVGGGEGASGTRSAAMSSSSGGAGALSHARTGELGVLASVVLGVLGWLVA